jgi:hypothetical protein
MEAAAGSIDRMYAFVDGVRRVEADGDQVPTWSGAVGDSKVEIKTRVTGWGDASYILGIDLPGTANDLSLTFQLQGGYHETKLEI